MENSDIIMMFIALLLGTQINRFLPLFLPQKLLTHPILQKLNQFLPLVIMVLLVLSSLAFPQIKDNYALFFAQITALAVVIISYRKFKNVLFSIAFGIACLNGVLFLLN